MTKTYCSLPFSHLYITTDGSVQPCCRFIFTNEEGIDTEWPKRGAPKVAEFKTLNDVLKDNPRHKIIQDKMLAGEKVEGCRSCYIEEEKTGSSMRTSENEQWGEFNRDTISTKSIEITFGNYCNLACRICCSELSTSWLEDEKKLVKDYPFLPVTERKNADKDWNTEDFSTVKQIKITGGEPLLHPDFTKFLDMLISTNRTDDINLMIYTNSSTIPKSHLIERLSKFKNVKLYLSIDGFGKVQEYIRHKSNWDITEKTYEAWLNAELEYPNIVVCFSPTISLFNIMYVEELIDWWIETRMRIHGEVKPHAVTYNIMNNPRLMSIHDFHKSKERADELEEYRNSNDFIPNIEDLINVVIENLRNVDDSSINNSVRKEFVQYTKDLDMLRKQDVKHSLPKLYELYEDLFTKYEGKLDKVVS